METVQKLKLVESVEHKKSMVKNRVKVPVMVVLVLLLIAAFLLSFTIGRYSVPLSQLLQIFFGKIFGLAKTWPDTVETVLFSVCIPRIFCALMVGAALAGSGATYQGLFKNLMVSPIFSALM